VSEAVNRCGYVALVGRPNVGKSTLLNALVGQKISIISPKPQTTRHRIAGILSGAGFQAVFLDTPGIHTKQQRGLNRAMNRAAMGSLADADLLLFVVDAGRFTREDESVLERIRQSGKRSVLVVNKCDQVKPRDRLLPTLERLSGLHEFDAVVPVSAQKGDNVNRLVTLIPALLPEGEPIFPADQVTDRSERFLAAEIVREKLTRVLHEELPYGITVEIERWEEDGDRVTIGAVIWVEREGQRKIVIGEGGQLLKEVGRAARLELNDLLERRVHLELWVKVREDWADSDSALRQFGYDPA
jgi:GTP-binding protein Era